MSKTTESIIKERLAKNNMYYRVGDTVVITDEHDMTIGDPLEAFIGQRVTIKEMDEDKETYRVNELPHEFSDADFDRKSCVLKDEDDEQY